MSHTEWVLLMSAVLYGGGAAYGLMHRRDDGDRPRPRMMALAIVASVVAAWCVYAVWAVY